MPLAFRKIERKVLWSQPPTVEEQEWLAEGELRADALSDIETVDNCLSVYLLEDTTAITVERVIGAVGATRDFVGKLDYVIFDMSLVQHLGITSAATPGQTPDSAVNGVHVDLIQLTAIKLAALGNSMQRHGQIMRWQPKNVGRLINRQIQSGYINASLVPPALLESLKNKKYDPE